MALTQQQLRSGTVDRTQRVQQAEVSRQQAVAVAQEEAKIQAAQLKQQQELAAQQKAQADYRNAVDSVERAARDGPSALGLLALYGEGTERDLARQILKQSNISPSEAIADIQLKSIGSSVGSTKVFDAFTGSEQTANEITTRQEAIRELKAAGAITIGRSGTIIDANTGRSIGVQYSTSKEGVLGGMYKAYQERATAPVVVTPTAAELDVSKKGKPYNVNGQWYTTEGKKMPNYESAVEGEIVKIVPVDKPVGFFAEAGTSIRNVALLPTYILGKLSSKVEPTIRQLARTPAGKGDTSLLPEALRIPTLKQVTTLTEAQQLKAAEQRAAIGSAGNLFFGKATEAYKDSAIGRIATGSIAVASVSGPTIQRAGEVLFQPFPLLRPDLPPLPSYDTVTKVSNVLFQPFPLIKTGVPPLPSYETATKVAETLIQPFPFVFRGVPPTLSKETIGGIVTGGKAVVGAVKEAYTMPFTILTSQQGQRAYEQTAAQTRAAYIDAKNFTQEKLTLFPKTVVSGVKYGREKVYEAKKAVGVPDKLIFTYQGERIGSFYTNPKDVTTAISPFVAGSEKLQRGLETKGFAGEAAAGTLNILTPKKERDIWTAAVGFRVFSGIGAMKFGSLATTGVSAGFGGYSGYQYFKGDLEQPQKNAALAGMVLGGLGTVLGAYSFLKTKPFQTVLVTDKSGKVFNVKTIKRLSETGKGRTYSVKDTTAKQGESIIRVSGTKSYSGLKEVTYVEKQPIWKLFKKVEKKISLPEWQTVTAKGKFVSTSDGQIINMFGAGTRKVSTMGREYFVKDGKVITRDITKIKLERFGSTSKAIPITEKRIGVADYLRKQPLSQVNIPIKELTKNELVGTILNIKSITAKGNINVVTSFANKPLGFKGTGVTFFKGISSKKIYFEDGKMIVKNLAFRDSSALSYGYSYANKMEIKELNIPKSYEEKLMQITSGKSAVVTTTRSGRKGVLTSDSKDILITQLGGGGGGKGSNMPSGGSEGGFTGGGGRNIFDIETPKPQVIYEQQIIASKLGASPIFAPRGITYSQVYITKQAPSVINKIIGAIQIKSIMQQQQVLQTQNLLQTQNIIQQQQVVQQQKLLQTQNILQTSMIVPQQQVLQQQQQIVQQQNILPTVRTTAPQITTTIVPNIINPQLETSTAWMKARKKRRKTIFEALSRRFGKELSLGKFESQEAAEKKLGTFLRGTLAASGKIKREGTALPFTSLKSFKGLEFRPAKRSMTTVVQRRGFRLGTGTERREIKKFKRSKLWR